MGAVSPFEQAIDVGRHTSGCASRINFVVCDRSSPDIDCAQFLLLMLVSQRGSRAECLHEGLHRWRLCCSQRSPKIHTSSAGSAGSFSPSDRCSEILTRSPPRTHAWCFEHHQRWAHTMYVKARTSFHVLTRKAWYLGAMCKTLMYGSRLKVDGCLGGSCAPSPVHGGYASVCTSSGKDIGGSDAQYSNHARCGDAIANAEDRPRLGNGETCRH
ncbi:hypothetical protein BCV70DRAFT_67146 [Testicularia cyperi]|uniref:Uncharacterized protein n=1 Tax=Testicularia cyperi TaxID=1882483 RepID=A0A317XGW3_9BASI|nr:hypothetical protein BCV70DRAFT_67146 [Testicularia cyperi]